VARARSVELPDLFNESLVDDLYKAVFGVLESLPGSPEAHLARITAQLHHRLACEGVGVQFLLHTLREELLI